MSLINQKVNNETEHTRRSIASSFGPRKFSVFIIEIGNNEGEVNILFV